MHKAIAAMLSKYECRGHNDYMNTLRTYLSGPVITRPPPTTRTANSTARSGLPPLMDQAIAVFVGLVSTIHKKLRTGEMAGDVPDAVKNRSLADCSGRFVVIDVAAFIVDAAPDIINTHARANHLLLAVPSES